MRLLFAINQRGTAVLMVTHNLSLIRAFPARHIRLEKYMGNDSTEEEN